MFSVLFCIFAVLCIFRYFCALLCTLDLFSVLCFAEYIIVMVPLDYFLGTIRVTSGTG